MEPILTVVSTTLDHLVLVVADVERTVAWYQRHLGLVAERLETWRAGEVPFPSLRINSETIIDVIAGFDGQRGHLDHLCFVVSASDLAAVRAEAAMTEGELRITDEGQRFGARGMATSIYVTDPDGLVVEFRAYP